MNQLSLVECNIYPQDRLIEFALDSEDNLTHKLGEILENYASNDLSDLNCDIDTDAEEAIGSLNNLLEDFEKMLENVANARTKKERLELVEDYVSKTRDDTDYILEKLSSIRDNSNKIHKLVD